VGVGAGHDHKIKGLEDIEGRLGLLHLQDHVEDDLGKRALDVELDPLVAAFLVQMYSHYGHPPDEPGMNNATCHVPVANEPLLQRGEAYAQTQRIGKGQGTALGEGEDRGEGMT